MSARLSPSTGRPYGVVRTCTAFLVPRSSFYAKTCPTSCPDDETPVPTKAKTGPKTELSDFEPTSLLRKDLDSSPFSGEGHRMVWARLKYGQGIPVSRKRMLRFDARGKPPLSPPRAPEAPLRTHGKDRVTSEPNEVWGGDGAQVFTLDDGWGWVFACLEHGNAGCLGWHLSKRGDRFAACEPVAQGILSEFGSVEAGSARGLSLRTDHGSQYLSNHFQKQIEAWGMAASFAFLEQPQAGGVVERFFRTLKEQVIYGRTYETLEEVRQAVAEFVEL